MEDKDIRSLPLREKLKHMQGELKAPKSQYNEFGHYNYRSCEDILEAIKPLCVKYGVVCVVTDTIERIGERYYIKATVTLYDCFSSDCMFGAAYAREEENKKGMDGSQVTGAASSYARKYALNGLFAIDDTKDSDATNVGDSGKKSGDKKAPAKSEGFPVQKIEEVLPEKYTKADVKRVSDWAFKEIQNIQGMGARVRFFASALRVSDEDVHTAVYKYIPDGVFDKASTTAVNSVFSEIKLFAEERAA